MENKKLILIKKELIDLISDSTIHAIPRIIKSNSFLIKILWLISFLVSTCGSLFLVKETIFDFLEYDVITSIETFGDNPALFPAITICSLHQYQNKNSLKLVETLLLKYNSADEDNKAFFISSEIFSYNDSFKQSLSYSINESMISCKFNNKECSSSEFQWIYHPVYGNCFRFNSDNKIAINSVGNNNGLKLKLFVGDPDMILDFISKSGYHLMIDNQSAIISPNEGYDIATGTETNVIINRLFTYKLPNPYNDCILDSFDSDFYKRIVSSNKTYRQNDCLNLCYQRQVIDECKCYSNLLDKLDSSVPCLDQNEAYCTLNVWNNFLKEGKKKCFQYCPLECNSNSFQISTFFNNFPTKQYAEKHLMTNPKITSKLVNDSLNYEKITKSVLALNVYYDQLTYTEINQIAKTQLVDLVSNIGGLLGLFLGLSFLSFCEIIEALLDVLIILVSKPKIDQDMLFEVKK